MIVRPFRPPDEQDVISVWRQCGLLRPWNDPHNDIARKMKVRPDLFLVGELNGRVIATVMAGYDGHRGWLYYLAVLPEQQRAGYGRAIVAEAERLLRIEGCPKINLQVRTSNDDVIAFYRQIGFAADQVLSLGKRLENDESL